MANEGFSQQIQHSDWKTEKHVPVIELPAQIRPDEFFEVKVNIGQEVPHPNTTDHHIQYITLYFHPEGDKYTYDVGHFIFNSHGQSVNGPDKGPVYTHHGISAWMKTNRPGMLYAVSQCNIHGLWESSREVQLAPQAQAQAQGQMPGQTQRGQM